MCTTFSKEQILADTAGVRTFLKRDPASVDCSDMIPLKGTGIKLRYTKL